MSGFVAKNNDTLPSSVEDLYCSSTVVVVSEMKQISDNKNVCKAGNSVNDRIRRSKERGKGLNRGKSFQTTLGSRFRRGLNGLVGQVNSFPFRSMCGRITILFLILLTINVVRQLRYSGVIEALRIQRLGFPNKFGYHDFIRCFDILFSDGLRWGVNSSQNKFPFRTFKVR